MGFFKILVVILTVLILLLQHRLWLGDGSIPQVRVYQQRLAVLKQQAKQKKQRNDALYAEVLNLRKADEAIEERARYELGMIRKGETFIQIIE